MFKQQNKVQSDSNSPSSSHEQLVSNPADDLAILGLLKMPGDRDPLVDMARLGLLKDPDRVEEHKRLM